MNITIIPLVTEYTLRINLVDGTSTTHSFNPYAYFGRFRTGNHRLKQVDGSLLTDTIYIISVVALSLTEEIYDEFHYILNCSAISNNRKAF